MDRVLHAEPAPSASEELEALVRRYARLVHSVVRRVAGAGAAELAEDVEQQVFIEIWKQVSREQRIEHPSSYIYRAAVRETVRTLQRERRHAAPAEAPEGVEPPGDGTGDPWQRLKGRQTGEEILEVIATLSTERQRAVRAHLSGFTVREIMRLETWSYNRARNLVARGMAQLRRGLKERGVHA